MRRRIRKEAVGMALFPFLAVLICTMGALVVLLVLLVQQAKVDAETAVAQQAHDRHRTAEEQRELQLAVEDAQWRRQVLEEQRQAKQQELADQRLVLSHIEDHIRRLEDAARSLTARIKELDDSQQADSASAAPLAAELSQLQQQLADKERELAEKRRQLASAEQSYTLIPYEGRSGTRRMPLYVECVEEGLIIQPEAVLISRADLDGPLGDGNPLDAALRAKRQHLARSGVSQGKEPYPLLVVRPSGVIAYQKAREAIKSWDDEFGYELISEELNLDFGERDVQLGQILQKAVADARRRQALLAASMPRQYRQQYADPPAGNERAAPPVEKSTASGRGVGTGTGGMGVGHSDRFADGRSPVDADRQGPEAGQAAAAGSPPAAEQPASASANSIKSQHGGDLRQQGVKGGVAGAKSGKSLPLGASAQRRGANWGLPQAQGRTFGVTRPIRVVCLADRLVLLSDRRDAPKPKEIALSPVMTQTEIDAFVEAIHRQMDGWGLAAENGYWKPQLHVEVAGDAGERFEELRAALQGSGIEVQRKQR